MPSEFQAPTRSRTFRVGPVVLSLMAMWFLSACGGLTSRASAADDKPSTPPQESPADFGGVPPVRFDPVEREIEGWTVLIDPALLEGEHRMEGEQALTMLANHLQRIKILIPATPLEKMQRVEIWIEHDHPRLHSMQYHPSEKWLIDHGHDPRLARKVHITQASKLLSREQMLKHPAVILHELAHAYHDQFIGFEDPEVIRVYEAGKAQGLYTDVLAHTGKMVRHYGLTNHKEYFAEGTEAYFYRNDFYPFVRAELQAYDPRLHDLLKSIWEPRD